MTTSIILGLLLSGTAEAKPDNGNNNQEFCRDTDGDGFGDETDCIFANVNSSNRNGPWVATTALGYDCDETDASINPAATEIWYDGVDQDCDQWSDYDQDFDGYDSDQYGGDDCDDLDPTILSCDNPWATPFVGHTIVRYRLTGEHSSPVVAAESDLIDPNGTYTEDQWIYTQRRNRGAERGRFIAQDGFHGLTLEIPAGYISDTEIFSSNAITYNAETHADATEMYTINTVISGNTYTITVRRRSLDSTLQTLVVSSESGTYDGGDFTIPYIWEEDLAALEQDYEEVGAESADVEGEEDVEEY